MKTKPRPKPRLIDGEWSTAENDIAVKLACSMRNKWFQELDDIGYGKPEDVRGNEDEREVYEAIEAEIGVLLAGWIERCIIAENIKKAS